MNNKLMKYLIIIFFFISVGEGYSQISNVDEVRARKIVQSPSYINSRVITVQDSILNCDSSNIFIKTLTSNIKFSLTNLSNNKWITFFVTNDSTGYLVQWNNVTWPNATAPSQSVGLGIYTITDIYSFIKINNKIYGTVIQAYR